MELNMFKLIINIEKKITYVKSEIVIFYNLKKKMKNIKNIKLIINILITKKII